MNGSAAGRVNVPYVSVIVPAYNVAGYLGRALRSALAQTMTDLEVIVVDDASSDGTLKVARRISALDSRVRVSSNERNSGPSASRNRAIGAAQGEWIALLDGDDAWLPERLERMTAHADKADVISDDLYIVHRSLRNPDRHVFWSFLREHGLNITEPYQISLLDLVRYDLGPAKPIFRRSFIERHRIAYDPAVRRGEDFLLFFEILASEARWLQLPQSYYLYTSGRDGSLSSERRTLWQSVTDNVQSLLDDPRFARDVALAAALKLLVQKGRNILAVSSARDVIRQRRFAELLYLLLKQPSIFLLAARSIARRLRLLHLARRYESSALHPAAGATATRTRGPQPHGERPKPATFGNRTKPRES